MRRPRDWFRQAELDLEAAVLARDHGRFEWACFAAHQAAEKAVKAVHQASGVDAWGHSVGALLDGLADVPDDVVEAARGLDKHYDRDGVVRRLREYARRELAPRPEVREAILFGSLARGDWSAGSDADVLVLVDERSDADYAPRARIGTGVDVFVYTPDDAERSSPRFRAEVDRAIVLYRRGE